MNEKSTATDELFRTLVDIPRAECHIGPAEHILLVGSCFADSIGQRLHDDHFPVVVNPLGVMYNPASILHTIDGIVAQHPTPSFTWAILTLGTNHIYVEKATGEIVDNCQKRPQQLFEERELSLEECTDYLHEAVRLLQSLNPTMHIVFTVSPIRYRKYGYHGSQLSKATLLLAVEKVILRGARCEVRGYERGYGDTKVQGGEVCLSYFPAYEILNDELRDYRFYASDMIHPSEQAVDYIYRRFCNTYFSDEAHRFADEWRPIREALAHKPFHPESSEYAAFLQKVRQQQKAFEEKYLLGSE